MKKAFLIIMCIFAIIILTNEVLILKDGKTINGKIIKMDEDTMTILTKSDEFVIDKEDIKIIYLNEEEYKKEIEKTKATEVKKETSDNIEMAFVEGGTFMMGDTWNDGMKDEQPAHEVTLNSFLIGKHEVTQKEWEEVMGNNPSTVVGEKLPVERISWYEAIAYCNKRSEKEGFEPVYSINKKVEDRNNTDKMDDVKWLIRVKWNANGYRLPTEAEWEYAARGGKKSKGYKYSGSNNIDEVAWYNGTSNSQGTREVGLKKPNELELYDMSGNVGEFCWDFYGNYTETHQKNPKGSSSGSERIMRGGSWFDNIDQCRIVDRQNIIVKLNVRSTVGFRVVRSIK